MFKVIATLVCLPFLGWAGHDFSAWKDSTRIFINTSSTGANITAAAEQFPLLVRLEASSLDWSKVAANGNDLRFADPDGSLLPHETEAFDAAARTASIWVRVPRVDAQSTTDHIVMFWNNPAAPNLSDGGAVFDTAQGYAGVWHFGEAGEGTGGQDVFRDATRNRNHGDDQTGEGTHPSVIAGGQSFDGKDDRIQVANSPSVSLAGPLSLSAWVKGDQFATGTSNANAILRKGDANPNSYQLGVNGSRFFLSLDANDNGGVQSKTVVATARYYHVAATWEGRSLKVYVNGVLESEGITPNPAGTLTKDARPLYIGGRTAVANDPNSIDHWNGMLDEVRLSRLAHTPQHIKLSFENQKAGSTILTFSAFPASVPLTDDLALWGRKRRITLNTAATGAAVPGPVEDFPVLVRLDTGIFDFAEALSGGQDIRFSDPDGTLLHHAMERWEAAAGKAEVWVKVPRVDGNSESDHITMHWGNPSAVHRHAPAQVFDTADGFRGVWHLGDGSRPANPGGGFLDATGLRHHGQDQVSKDGSAALIGNGVEFRSGTDRISVPSTDFLGFTDSLALSAWIMGTAWDSGAPNPIIRKGEDPVPPYQMAVDSGHLSLRLNGSGGSGGAGHRGLSKLKAGRWHHVAATLGGGQIRLYVDGKMDLAAPIPAWGALPKNNLPLILGGQASGGSGGTGPFRAFLDEVLVSSRPPGGDWFKLAYENQKAATRFLVHAGYESKLPAVDTSDSGSKVIPADTSRPSRVPWTYDTVLTAGQEIQDSLFHLRNPGPEAVRVVISPSGDTAAKGVTGVQGLFRFIPQEGGMPPLVLTVDTSIAAGRSLYRLVPGVDGWGTLDDKGPAAGTHGITEAGAFTLAKDTLAPVLEILDQGVDGNDSSWVSVRIEDNIRTVNFRCFPQGNTGETVLFRQAPSGEAVRLALLPVADPVPLKITLSADDGRLQTAFPPPPAMAYVLARSLSGLSAPIASPSGLEWNLHGLPVRPQGTLTMGALSGASGAGGLHGAVWMPDPQDPVRGAYRILGPDDTLPSGTGVWLAGEKAFASLPLGGARSFPQVHAGGYALSLRRGWNLITSPALENLPWVVSKRDLPAYDQSAVKGLHAHLGGDQYSDADTLEPWKGYFVFSGTDTTVELRPEGPALAEPSLRKAGKTDARPGFAGDPLLPIQVFLQPLHGPDGGLPAPAALRLGAASYASDGLAREDEYMPASPRRGGSLGISRARRGLRTDLVAFRKGGNHFWKLAWSGQGPARPAAGRLRVARMDLPGGFELRAATFGGTGLVGEGDTLVLSGEASDTLVLWAAPKGSWKDGDPVPGLSPRPLLLSASLRNGPEGLGLRVALPEASTLRASVHAADGRRLASLERALLAPGHHDLVLASGGDFRARGILFVTVEILGGGEGFRAAFRAFRP